MNTILFRPVGLQELSLVWDAGMRRFPPRLPQQPIFYPVADVDYARQIARDWNTKDESSGFAGYVTAFEVESDYLSKFEPRTVGSSTHVEYWIPADQLGSFNEAIRGRIRLEEGFFGTSFAGYVPSNFNLQRKDAIAQFVFLVSDWEYNIHDVLGEVYANRKSVFLNWLFWRQHDFSEFDISEVQRNAMLENIRRCWEHHKLDKTLPLI
jgi:hypothetical protein